MTAFRRQGISWLTAALLGIRCRTHHWRRLETCSAWQYWAAYFQGGSKVILTPAVPAAEPERHANDRWAQVKLHVQSCGGGRSATATQRRKESSASSCTICTMMQSWCAVEDDGRRIVFAAAPPVAAASRFSWTQPSWAHWAAFKSILRSRRVGSARTRAVEAAYGS